MGAGHVLTRSPGRRPTGEFYKDIAHPYQPCVALGGRPSKTIADDGAAIATVTGWVAQARRRRDPPPAGHAHAHALNPRRMQAWTRAADRIDLARHVHLVSDRKHGDVVEELAWRR